MFPCCVGQVVFRSGQGALQVLPPLVDVIPEARLNLVIYHLRQGDTSFLMFAVYITDMFTLIILQLQIFVCK